MFGILRFVLAFVVAMSHMGVIGVTNFGVSAVVVFYILSGYVMSHSFSSNFGGKINNSGRFYIDRIMRIYPMYLIILIITIVFLVISGFGHTDFTYKNVFLNLLIIPLNFFMFTDSSIILQDPKWNLIPPAWSLGAELQFYLLVPFLIRFRQFRIAALVISITIFISASIGLINTDIYGYRLLPGVLFIFLTGTFLYSYRKNQSLKDLKLIKTIYVIILLLFIGASLLGKMSLPYTYEVLLGYLTGVIIVFILSGVNHNIAKKTDDLLGGISYPLFLCHFLSVWIFQYIFERLGFNLDIKGLSVIQLLFSIGLSYLSFKFIDVPIQRFRKKRQQMGRNLA